MKIIDRLNKYINHKEVSFNAFDKSIGASNGYIGRQIKNKASVGGDIIEKISCVYTDLNLEWLITGKGSMLKDEKVNIQQPVPTQAFEVNKSIPTLVSEPAMSIYNLKTDYYGLERQMIPFYEMNARLGLNVLFSSQSTQIPLDYISVPNAPKCDGALSVRGDSMYPILKAGDIVCYKIITDLMNIVYGEMYLLDIDNGDDQYLTVKFIKKSDAGNDYVTLASENRHHANKDIPISQIRALAIIKLSIRYNTIS